MSKHVERMSSVSNVRRLLLTAVICLVGASYAPLEAKAAVWELTHCINLDIIGPDPVCPTPMTGGTYQALAAALVARCQADYSWCTANGPPGEPNYTAGPTQHSMLR